MRNLMKRIKNLVLDLSKNKCNNLSLADPEAGLRLLNAFSHLVFIDVDDTDILRSPLLGEPSVSTLLRNSSFCK